MPPNSRDELLRLAHRRLYPTLADPNFLVLQSRRRILQEWIRELRKGATLTVLDVGGRLQPYRPLFESPATRYWSCDIAKTELVDVVGSGEALPFASEFCDVVLCTQVFEYFTHPHIAAMEMHRVLKPKGVLLMSVVSCAPRFGDDEHWRYTPSGIRELLRSFSTTTITPETLSVGGLLRTINLGVHTFAHFRLLRRMCELTICPCINLIGLGFEKLRVTENDQFAPNYSVIAFK